MAGYTASYPHYVGHIRPVYADPPSPLSVSVNETEKTAGFFFNAGIFLFLFHYVPLLSLPPSGNVSRAAENYTVHESDWTSTS